MGDGYTLQELKKNLYAGYQYVDLSYPSKAPPFTVTTANCHLCAYSRRYRSGEEGGSVHKNNELRASSPCIPDEVYERFPGFLKDALKPARKKRERDILLLASSLPGNESKAQPMQSYFRIRPIIESLPEIFTYKEVKQKALPAGISERSVCRYLKKLTVIKLIDKQGDKYIKNKNYPGK